MKKFLFLVILFTVFISKTNAVPAYPYPIKYTQPDGSVITVQLKGDERVHWAESSDGYTLLSNGKNGWEYAVADQSGDIKASGILAREVGKRTVNELKMLKGVSKNIRFSSKQVNTLKAVWEAKYGSDKLIGTGEFFKKADPKSTVNDGRRKVFTPKGTKKLIMILIEFTDVKFSKTRQNFVDLMNTQNYNQNGAEGSVRDYFREQSYWVLDNAKGFDIETVVAPNIYTADYDMAHYGAPNGSAHDIRANDLMKEAIQKADPDVDYTQYDNDNDGSIDGVYIIYAGYGEATGGGVNTIWPHAGGVTGTFDTKTASKYSCSNELNTNGTLTSIGVICHEFGHVCGAPDYYDTDYADGGSFTGTGNWDLMATGVYNGTKSGSQPAHFNPFEKIRAGWLTPITLTTPTRITDMPDITTTPVVYKYNTNTDGEYYLMENRQKTGFNAGCPGHGLMIYHYSKSYWDASANKTAPQGFYPVCASSGYSPTTTSDKSTYGSINTGGCPFPGTSAKDSFTDATTPTAKDWGGNNTAKPITTISESGGLITFTFISVPSINPILSFDAKAASSSQINLTWTNNSAGNSVIIARNTSATFGTPVSGTTYTPGTALSGGGEIIYAGSAESFDDTGLSASTPYYYQIWATDGTNYSEPATVSASTACSSVSSPLFSEGFEGGLSSCWEQEHILNEKDWAIQTGGYKGNNNALEPLTAHTGTKNACLFSGGWTSYTTKLITPPINISAAAKPTLKFWHTQSSWSGRQDILRVYYRTSLTDTWKQLAIYTNSITSWTLETIDLPNPSSAYYIAFETNTNYGYGVCLDDIEVWKDAGDNQWTGATSTDWFDASNWSTGVVPTSTNNVEIPSGTPYSPVISATGATCQNIIIDNGATLTMNNSTAYTLTVTGDWTNNGTFAYGVGTVSFEGTNSLQTIGGSSTSSFYILQVKKGNADNILEVTSPIELKASLGYSSPLNLVSGTFKLSANSTITPFTNQTSILENCAIWNNGGTIEFSNKDMLVRGLFKQTNGTSNFKRLQYRLTNGVIDIQGGTVNISRALSYYTSGEKASFKMSGGVININPTTSTTNTDVPFLLSSTSTFSMSGGTICIANSLATTSANAGGDFQNLASTYTVTGGTLQIGNANTTGSPIIRINSTVPIWNLVVNGTGSPTAKIVTNNLSVLNDVSIATGSVLQVSPSIGLTVNGAFTNNGILNLLSDANGTATIITKGTVSAGTYNINQYLALPRRTWYMSSPVASASPTGMDRIKSYNEATNEWAAATLPMVVGKGYSVTPPELNPPTNILFTGALNTGEKTIELQKDGSTSQAGFNFVGNPYPSYIDWKAVVAETKNKPSGTSIFETGTMWYRSKIEGNFKFYTVDGAGVVVPGTPSSITAFVPPMQGFWVKTNADASTLYFEDNMRSHAGTVANPSPNALKAPAATQSELSLLRLQVSNGTNTDEAVIYSYANATDGYDFYDSPKMMNNDATIPEIYTTLNNKPMVINVMNSLPLDTEIGLAFVPGDATSFSLRASEITNLPSDVKVILKDYANNGQETDLTDGAAVYNFTPATTTGDRFSVIFRSAGSTTAVNSNTNKGISVYSHKNGINVTVNAELSEHATVSVFNAVGQQLVNQHLTNRSTTINGNFNPGVYVVKVSNGTANTTQKIVIK